VPKQGRWMESTIMFKNIIIATLLYMLVFNVSFKDFFKTIRKGLDKAEEIVYDVNRSVK
jgi:hypothetical protein